MATSLIYGLLWGEARGLDIFHSLLQSGCWALVGILPLPYVACCESGAQTWTRERHQGGEVDARSGRARGGRGGGCSTWVLAPLCTCGPSHGAHPPIPQVHSLQDNFKRATGMATSLIYGLLWGEARGLDIFHSLLQSGCWALVGIVPLPYVACCESGAQTWTRERHQGGEVDARSGRARGGRGGLQHMGACPPVHLWPKPWGSPPNSSGA